MAENYYTILGVPKTASPADIKKAFRRLAMQYHPDRNPGNLQDSEAKFKEINEAYEILGDEQSRWQYDRLKSYPHGPIQGQDIFGINMDADISEILRKYAGMGFIVRGMGWGRGYGHRQGCRRQWRQDID